MEGDALLGTCRSTSSSPTISNNAIVCRRDKACRLNCGLEPPRGGHPDHVESGEMSCCLKTICALTDIE